MARRKPSRTARPATATSLFHRLRCDPGFKELEDIRALCARYLDEDGYSSREADDGDDEYDRGDILPEGLTRDHFKDDEMAQRARSWAGDFDAVMAFLQLVAATASGRSKMPKAVKQAYPKDVPRFEGPAELIRYFKDRWEKLKCRYC